MSRPSRTLQQPLEMAPARRYRTSRLAGFAFVLLSLFPVGLITWGVVTQPGGGTLVPLYLVVAVLFIPYFFLASRQRAAIYPDGILPPHRRPGEFLGAKQRFVPFSEIDRVVFVRNALAPSQLLYAQLILTSGRRDTLYPGEVGRGLLQRLVEIAEGRAIASISLPHEYRVEKW